MNEDRWSTILDLIQERFPVLEHTNKPLEPGPGKEERIVFQAPQGRLMLTRTTSPKFLGTQVLSSRRIGSEVKETRQYSDTESVHTMKAFRWDSPRKDWIEIQPDEGLPFPAA